MVIMVRVFLIIKSIPFGRGLSLVFRHLLVIFVGYLFLFGSSFVEVKYFRKQKKFLFLFIFYLFTKLIFYPHKRYLFSIEVTDYLAKLMSLKDFSSNNTYTKVSHLTLIKFITMHLFRCRFYFYFSEKMLFSFVPFLQSKDCPKDKHLCESFNLTICNQIHVLIPLIFLLSEIY